MHEFARTSAIVKTVIAIGEEKKAKTVLEVQVVIGKLTSLSIEQVKFCYEAIVKGTMLDGSKLFIEEIEPKVACNKCGYTGDIKFKDDLLYHFSVPTLCCPRCNETVHVVEGNECVIRKIKLEI